MTQTQFPWLVFVVAVGAVACSDGYSAEPPDPPDACSVTLAPGDNDQEALQGALIDAKSGDTICLKKGTYKLDGQLSLAQEKVVVRGEEGTLLDFSDQSTGANGIELSADHDTLDTLRIQNTKGDGVRATQVDYPTIRNVHVEWTGGPSKTNGGYGIYPVTSSHVLIEDCFASGASDTGIYVGQSHDIVIRNSEATGNVAGIEIENSSDAEVYNNKVHGNTAGILIFNLPGLAVKDGQRANVHDNTVEDNNLENFAGSTGIIADLPTGTGMFILAADDNELHGNTVKNHKSTGISVVSWYVTQRDDEGKKDADYDWFPEHNNVHDNTLSDNGKDLQGRSMLIGLIVGLDELPDLVWDGIFDSEKDADNEAKDGVPPESLRNCFKGNGEASFVNLDLEHDGEGKSTDITPYECSRDGLPAIKL